MKHTDIATGQKKQIRNAAYRTAIIIMMQSPHVLTETFHKHSQNGQ